MTASFEDTLRAVLDRATGTVATAGLTAVAIHEAKRRRGRRRGAAAAGAASVLVVSVVVVVTQLADGRGVVSPPPATSTPSLSPSSAPTSPSPSTEPTDAGVRQLVQGTQPEWDPRQVDDLPAAVNAARFLPDVVAPPSSSTSLAEAPVEAAVLVVQVEKTAHLLSTTGEWRSVPLSGRSPYLALSPEGTRLVEWHWADGPDDEVTVYDLASGTSRRLAYPADYTPWDFTSWTWTDEDTLLVAGGGGWLVDASSGASEQVPYPEGDSWALDPKGALVETSSFTKSAELTDWAGGAPRKVSEAATGRLLSLQADADTVVGTSYDERPYSVIVADRESMTPQSVLPLVDPEANYSNGGLGVLAPMDDGSVLLRVVVFGSPSSLRVVRWDPASGDLSLVTKVQTPIENAVTFATGLLRQSDS